MSTTKRIAILGEYDPMRETHVATTRAMEHSARALGLTVEWEWVSTAAISEELFSRTHGIWIAPGSPYRDQEKTLRAIRFAREEGVPCLGTCGGFQHIILEYARNVLGFPDAQSEENDPNALRPLISHLACSLRGREMTLRFSPGSLVERLYGSAEAREKYYCNFGVNPAFVEQLRSGPMQVTGADAEGEIRIVEWPNHPFFLGTLYVPQAQSSPDRPHPVVSGFLQSL